MVTQLQPDVRAYLHGGEVIKRYIRVEEVAHEYGFSVEETEYIAKAASSLYKLTRIHLVKKERFDEFMKHIYKVPGTNKQIIKKFARIGEASIIYSIGRHRFIELARAAGATYKINEGTGGTVLVAVLMPFNVQELNDSTGNYYGINQISKNVNIGNRKKLINGNGFVFGVPGSGKSFFCKMEMGSVFLSGDDEIIVIDPMNEYFDIAETYGGTVVNMSTYTDNYVNPLEMDVWSLDPNDSKGMVREKGEFMLGLCEQCIGDSLNSRQKSIIDRCVRKLYIDIARSKEKYIPVMSDFYDILMAQPEDEAKDIALSLELFVNGSLNIFNHQTNVDVDNRFTVYGIRDLGTELSPITMLVMMESIQNRIVENGKRGKATWLYIDEFHVLLNSEYSAKYLQQLWKKVRKQGGLCTGITQNVVDLLQNYTATTMLANSEFVALLKQANTDSSKMAEVIGVSEAQLRFVTNTASGMGLIKCGSVVIPFDNQISKDTDLYRLYNTNIHEKIAEQKKKEAMLQ